MGGGSVMKGRHAFSAGFLVMVLGVMYWQLSKPYQLPSDVELRVKKALNEAMVHEWRRFCVKAGPFPYESGVTRIRDPISGYTVAGSCERCADLQRAGLVEMAWQEYGSQQKLYRLTEEGKKVYKEDMRPNGRGLPEPGFCFAEKVVLKQIVEALPPMQDGSSKMYGVKYMAEVVSPHPVLLNFAQNAALGMKMPLGASPALYGPEITTVRFYAGSEEVEVDPGTRYGKWALKDE